VRAQPGSDEFVEVLRRIENAIQFFQQHPQVKGRAVLVLKFEKKFVRI
jgi:hypothetical protein